MERESDSVRAVGWGPIAVALLLLVTLATRLPAPWGAEVIGDEMLHLESWRNRFRTDDMVPLFLRRLESNPRFSPQQKQVLKDLYHSAPWFQRLVFIQVDSPSPAYAALGEVVEIVSHSSLLALRLPSVAFSLGAVLLAYLLGRTLSDSAQGLWLAALLAIGPLPQVYAGIGRPHALAQAALFAVVLAFVAERRSRDPSPGRFLLVALLAQMTHWSSWAVIGPLVAGELIIRMFEGSTLLQIVRQTWWYAVGSFLLLGIFVIQSTGTSAVGANVGYPGAAKLWQYVCVASPFGHLASFGPLGLWVSGLAFVVLVGWGLRAVFAPGYAVRSVRWPFLATVLVSAFATCVMCAGVRHMMIYATVPIVLAAVGARSAFSSPKAARAGLAVVLAAFTPLSLLFAEDPYRYILVNDPRYSEIARDLEHAMKPGDVWISWPYFAANPLYRYHRFPEPIQPLTEAEFLEALRDRPADHACFVLTAPHVAVSDPALQQASWQVMYPSGMTLVKLPPRAIASPRTRE